MQNGAIGERLSVFIKKQASIEQNLLGRQELMLLNYIGW